MKAAWAHLTLCGAGWQPRVVLACLIAGAVLHLLLILR